MIDGARTRDNQNHNLGLYQLSYDRHAEDVSCGFLGSASSNSIPTLLVNKEQREKLNWASKFETSTNEIHSNQDPA